MKPNVSLCLAIISFASVSLGQEEGGLKKKVHRTPVIASSAPVTEAEAFATFQRIAGLMKSVAHINVKPTPIHGKPTAPATKAEIVAELTHFYQAAEPSFTNTPRRIHVELGRVIAKSPTLKKQLIFLIGKGFVGNYGPLATGATTSVTPTEFGDSLGFFLTQICECTNTSSTKWTPYLRTGD